MSKARDNHYVPKWYQKGFLFEDEHKLLYLSINPRESIKLPNGETKNIYLKKWYSPSQCFYRTDLYTTIFGNYINDDIEKKLFGDIDDKGAMAIRAFVGDDFTKQHDSFSNLFIYLDTQKLRTPKGLDWIKFNYPSLNQVELMHEMQALRNLHFAYWTEGVREIVSAKKSNIKFIISDHPVTVYNHACSPNSSSCSYPNDPDIALKASQTLFPLDKDHLLILTNLEYAKNPDGCPPLEKRTHSQRLRQSLVRTDAFIRTRELNNEDVHKVNYILKTRANEYIAAADESWLYPEKHVVCEWKDLSKVLLPPETQLYQFGGQIYVGYEDGTTQYQDAYGRKRHQHTHFNKNVIESKLGRNDPCGCGSGRKYKKCCKNISLDKRPSWKVLGIRERNLILYNAIYGILGIRENKTWFDIKQQVTNEQIKEIYGLYGQLWPPETDIYDLLPKPDKKLRGLFTGIIDPRTIHSVATGAALLFDELLMRHPFINPNIPSHNNSPVEFPEIYKYQFFKDVLLLLELEPLVISGTINLIPDPLDFDFHLQQEWYAMANKRYSDSTKSKRDGFILKRLTEESSLHVLTAIPEHNRARLIQNIYPRLNTGQFQQLLKILKETAEHHPLALPESLERKNEQLIFLNVTPNYEMSLFIAQATGSVVLTDCETRWNELQQAQQQLEETVFYPLQELSEQYTKFPVYFEPETVLLHYSQKEFLNFRRNLSKLIELGEEDGSKQVIFLKEQIALNMEEINLTAIKEEWEVWKMDILMPSGGFIDKNVQRLLKQSNSLSHQKSVPMVIYISPP